MSKTVQTIVIIVGVLVVLFGVGFIDAFVYPLRPDHPNYSDVEKAFAKFQFPADWKEIHSSENRGIHGRGCDPLNGSGCFHKTITFRVSEVDTAKAQIKDMIIKQGCDSITEEPTYEGNSNTTPKTATNLTCRIQGGVILGASTSQQRGEISVGVSTR